MKSDQQQTREIRAVVLDIEGTTTEIDFVYQTLFPYARLHLAEFLNSGMDERDFEQLREEFDAETALDLPVWMNPPVAYLLWLMDQDRKSRGLKSIQGKIWEKGYRDGSLRGALFPDVPRFLKRWRAEGGKVYIYSSGSVQAQRLLFEYSVFGNLTQMIDGYFDTAVGPKRAVSSYQSIASETGIDARECLFVSDIAEECGAARDAGMATVMSIRPGNSPQQPGFQTISSFDELPAIISRIRGGAEEECIDHSNGEKKVV